MHHVRLFALLLVLGACGDDSDDDDRAHAGDGGGHAHDDAGAGKAGTGGTGGSESSQLDRPGSLPRPPKSGLPAELRPPR